ncbi:MAG: hypothetical protein IVW57_16210 [Ktedonobacterales bacterium]|nr:hypothetical protein [Ktedonobacterales bacterium]
MRKQLSEGELIRLQIQAYEFYAGLIDRAVETGAHDVRMPRWDEQRALEYRQLAEQLRRRLAELEAEDKAAAERPAIVPVPTVSTATEAVGEAEAAPVSETTAATNG